MTDALKPATATVGDTVYPFSAIVGQEPMKLALILAAIHPGLGGVLIRGSKGAAKSTAVRALAALLPNIEVVPDDPFRRAPGEVIAEWPLPDDAKFVPRPVSLINLPVGATDDRVVGSLNFERALTTGRRTFEPGLLAAAHRGLLYIDEVNLLGDHLVDVLLDAAAMGVNHVEREGLAFRHPARFVLVGTMNPEEGDLRPQLLDRFGLAVDVEPMTDPRQRAEVVRRRLAFEANPARFRAHWAEADQREGARIAEAQRLLPSVIVPDAILEALCTRCARDGADGLRADLTIYKAATALAAHDGRTTVTTEDIEAVAELALSHRRTTHGSPPTGSPPPPPPPPSGEEPPRPERPAVPPRNEYYASQDRRDEPRASAESTQGEDNEPESQVIPAASPPLTPRLSPPRDRSRRATAGRRGMLSAPDRQGVFVRAAVPKGRAHDPAIAATLGAAAPWQVARGRDTDQPLILHAADLHDKVRARRTQHLVLFVVDASRSMGARRRMARTKGAVLSLLIDAYQKRERVGLIAFGGTSATLTLPPTRSVRVAARCLNELPVGGLTPLAHGLVLAERTIAAVRRREPGIAPLVVLLTDGRGNVPLQLGGNPEADATGLARRLAQGGVAGLVIDTEEGPIRFGLASRLARAWGAEVLSLDALGERRFPDVVRKALFAG
ncbi:protoporphyrin IX magnesium-chelatase [Singulisphaera sp. GP187]|uniref:VWA domain-containing protein n=1 Tax=Singulisphaera sp. GP187 TaxID=1882752 RepID=UPI00092BD8AB|nr:VWA domain-containing protein [Singulisphaera sp. GP187]SIO63056.1 protoporphyrin IX magnesium-chelatase [Singulisphaera sp. GP187]